MSVSRNLGFCRLGLLRTSCHLIISRCLALGQLRVGLSTRCLLILTIIPYLVDLVKILVAICCASQAFQRWTALTTFILLMAPMIWIFQMDPAIVKRGTCYRGSAATIPDPSPISSLPTLLVTRHSSKTSLRFGKGMLLPEVDLNPTSADASCNITSCDVRRWKVPAS